jgi:pyruvate kinase
VRNAHDVDDMIAWACEAARGAGVARDGDSIAIAAGLPFGEAGTANLLHIAKVGR